MIKKINIKKETAEYDILFFKEINDIKRLSFLCGPNGVGKTTLINGIINNTIDITSSKEYDIIPYINSKNNFRKNSPSPYLDSSIYNKQLCEKVIANGLSEGQSIIFSVINTLEKLSKLEKREDRNWIIVFDEIDSGLSLDNITFICNWIIDILKERKDIQFIISFNNFHFAYMFGQHDVLMDMFTGKYMKIKDYNDYIHYFEKNRIIFNKKRKHNAVTGEIG